jgi:predicted nucleic acid-binding protein
VSAFADTSFLFAFYFPRATSESAVPKMEALQDPALISSLVRFEFQQAVWFKVWLHAQGHPLRLSETSAQSVLAAFHIDLEQGLWALAEPAWEAVVARAERIAIDHTPRHGARAMDSLHLAFALQMGATELMSFDENQRHMGQAEGLALVP